MVGDFSLPRTGCRVVRVFDGSVVKVELNLSGHLVSRLNHVFGSIKTAFLAGRSI